MKKLLLSLFLSVAAVTNTFADDFGYLTFQTSSGKLTSVAVSSLVLKVSGTKLVATNASGTTEFTLADLSKMYFSAKDEATNISSLTDNGESAYSVYTLSGVSIGTFKSMDIINGSLKSGVYIVKCAGKTHKLVIK